MKSSNTWDLYNRGEFLQQTNLSWETELIVTVTLKNIYTCVYFALTHKCIRSVRLIKRYIGYESVILCKQAGKVADGWQWVLGQAVADIRHHNSLRPALTFTAESERSVRLYGSSFLGWRCDGLTGDRVPAGVAGYTRARDIGVTSTVYSCSCAMIYNKYCAIYIVTNNPNSI